MAVTTVVTEEGFKIGIAQFGKMGYTVDPKDRVFPSREEAQEEADRLNEHFEVNKKQAWLIVLTTMFRGCTVTLDDIEKAS